MNIRNYVFFMLMLTVWLPSQVMAQSSTQQRAKTLLMDEDRVMTELPMFQAFHPDERWLQYGMNERAKGRPEAAREYFLRAARYASKPAQAMYALMLWQGEGGAKDRSLAYAWMDLAAERGYPGLLVERERLWQALSADEQARAMKVGLSVYAEYGDDVAKPRLEKMLRRGQLSQTGSRVGAGTSRVQVYRTLGEAAADPSVNVSSGGRPAVRTATTGQRGEVQQFWDNRYWEPDAYWAFQEQRWSHFATGTVTVNPLVPVGN